MVNTCSVGVCRKSSPNLAYFVFPKNPKVREQWIKACKQKGLEKVKVPRICELHFREEDFETDMNELLISLGAVLKTPEDNGSKRRGPRKRLKKGVVPTLNLLKEEPEKLNPYRKSRSRVELQDQAKRRMDRMAKRMRKEEVQKLLEGPEDPYHDSVVKNQPVTNPYGILLKTEPLEPVVEEALPVDVVMEVEEDEEGDSKGIQADTLGPSFVLYERLKKQVRELSEKLMKSQMEASNLFDEKAQLELKVLCLETENNGLNSKVEMLSAKNSLLEEKLLLDRTHWKNELEIAQKNAQMEAEEPVDGVGLTPHALDYLKDCGIARLSSDEDPKSSQGDLNGFRVAGMAP